MDIEQLPGIETRIQVMRGIKVMVDADLAALYGVTTKRLNEQVKRNRARFPGDFMFQLSEAEKTEVVANCDHLRKLKFSKSLPHAFTEHGAIQAANVLASPQAIEMGIHVVRAFVCMRALATTHDDLSGASRRWNTRPRRWRCTTTSCSMTPTPSCGRCSMHCAR